MGKALSEDPTEKWSVLFEEAEALPMKAKYIAGASQTTNGSQNDRTIL